MINFSASNTKFLTATVALFAIVGSACGTAATTSAPDTATEQVAGTDPVAAQPVAEQPAAAQPAAEAPATPSATVAATPAAEAPAAPVVASTPAPTPPSEVAAAPAVDDEQYYNEELTSRQLIPASGFAFPCDEYFTETTYPVFPCSTGQLVEDFQSIMHYVDPDFVVDGYFGEDTYDAVTGLQSSFGMYPTGIIDDVLLEMIDQSILHDDPEESDDDSGDVINGHTMTDEQLADLCNSYVVGPGEELNWDLITACEDIGIRMVSGD